MTPRRPQRSATDYPNSKTTALAPTTMASGPSRPKLTSKAGTSGNILRARIPPLLTSPNFVRASLTSASNLTANLTLFPIPGNAAARQKILDDAKPWLSQDKIARARIFRALSGGQLHLVRHTTYAKEAWDALRDCYQPPNSALGQSKKTALQAYLCTPDMDLAAWLTDMQRLYNVLLGVQPDAMTDEAFALTVLNQLPETSEWLSFAAGLRQRINAYAHAKPPTSITSREVITCIRDEHYFRTKNNPEASAQVFTARSAPSVNTKRTSATRPDASGSSTAPAKRARVQKTCSNSNCGRKGHENTDCFAFGGGNQGNYSSAWRGPWNIHLPPTQRTRDNNVPPTKSQPAQANATIFSAPQYVPLEGTDPGPFSIAD